MRQYLKHKLSKKNIAKILKLERLLKLVAKPSVLISLKKFDYLKNYLQDNRFSTKITDSFPITGENTKYTSFDRHYVYHTAWAARVVSEIKPQTHTDISSSLYFSGIVSAFNPVQFYDYRPANLQLSGLTTNPGDLMKLPFADRSIESISCMHTIEHIGLGRYGDPLDPKGDLKALNELKRVVKIGGNLILVVPVGKQRIEFNAHRIYNPKNFVSYITETGSSEVENISSPEFKLKEYAYIPETDTEGPIKRDSSLSAGEHDRYACGCFWFTRIA